MSLLGVWLALIAAWGGAQSPPPAVRQQARAIPRDRYVGGDACRPCHQSVVEPFLHSGHALTSQSGTRDAIRGSLTEGSNTAPSLNSALSFRMEARNGEFFQTAVFGVPPNITTRSERMDVVIGSGRRGQTYMWWNGNRLFSLPVRYWAPSNEWVPAGPYRDGTVSFDTPPPESCLDCHFTSLTTVPNGYDRTSLMFGVSCEKCHGPAREHVASHRAGAPVPAGLDIVNPARLPRDRRLEVCAACHSDVGSQITPHFSYVPGEPLANYLPPSVRVALARPSSRGPENTGQPTPDVHGRQLDLLKMSRCFQASPTMTCETCHDVHQTQRDLVSMSARCTTCHKTEACGLFPTRGRELDGRCVDCHMPLQASALGTTTPAGFRSATLRTHWIKVYP